MTSKNKNNNGFWKSVIKTIELKHQRKEFQMYESTGRIDSTLTFNLIDECKIGGGSKIYTTIYFNIIFYVYILWELFTLIILD